MKRFLYMLCVLMLAFVMVHSDVSAQETRKKIIVKVIDASTQNVLEGFTVKLTGAVASQTKTTDNQGNAYFDWVLTLDEDDIKMEVTEKWPASHYPFTSTFTISKKEDQYNQVAAMKSMNMRFNVNVIDDASKNSIPGAKVTVMIADGRGNTGFTDASGNIVLDIEMLSNFPFINIDAEKDGYSRTEKTVELNPDVRRYNVELSLLRRGGTKILKVSVIDESNNPVTDASVQAQGATFPDLYTGITGADGTANLICKTGGKFTVTVRHSNFEPAQKEITVNVYGYEDIYASFTVKRKKGLLRNVTVKVKDAATNKPIVRASVDANSVGGITNSKGEVYLKKVVALGETGQISVVAHGYEPTTLNYIGGGENYRYSPPLEDQVSVYLKKEKTREVKFIIQVLNKATERPIAKATVSMKNKNGRFIISGKNTNVKGEVETMLNKEEWPNAPFRVSAKASGYTEHWSDITPDFLNAENDPLFFTIYLEEKKAFGQTNEKKYGPFSVTSSQWALTGISFKKGDYFRIEANGYFTTKDGQKIGPEGGGYWTWWTLAGQIGKQRLYLSRAGGGNVLEDGVLELGTPRGLGSKEFVKEDIENLQGKLTVYVFSRSGVWDKTSQYNYRDAENDLHLLTQIHDRDPNIFTRRTTEEIVQEYQRIVAKYDFPETASMYGEFHCTTLLAHSMVNEADRKDCASCINNTINALRKKMEGMKK